MICKADGCETPARSKGFYKSHYDRYRYAGDPHLQESAQQRVRYWNIANRSRKRDNDRKLYLRKRAQRIAAARAWAITNRELRKEIYRLWVLGNRDRRRHHARQYQHRRRAGLLGAKGNVTAADWLTLIGQHPRCYYCNRLFTKDLRRTHDHVIPLSRGGENTIENSVCACRSCNSRKNAGPFNPVTGQRHLVVRTSTLTATPDTARGAEMTTAPIYDDPKWIRVLDAAYFVAVGGAIIIAGGLTWRVYVSGIESGRDDVFLEGCRAIAVPAACDRGQDLGRQIREARKQDTQTDQLCTLMREEVSPGVAIHYGCPGVAP